MADFDGLIQPSADWVDVPSLSNTAIAIGGTSGAGVMNAQATALTKRTNYLYNYTVQYNATNGYVGIGVASPTAILDISDGSSARYQINPSTGSTRHYSRNSSDSAYVSAQYDALQHVWKSSGVESARIDPNLNFGVGTQSPFFITNYKTIDVRGTNGAFYYGGNTAASKTFRMGYNLVSDSLELNAISNNSIQIKTFDTSRLVIDNVGTVAIGTTTTSGGTGNTIVEGRLIAYQPSSNVPAITVPYPGGTYAGFKLVHQSTNVAGASDYTDFRIRPAYSAGVATGADQTFLRVVNTYPRTNIDLNLTPDGGNVGIGVNPSTWTTYKALEIASGGHGIFGTTGQVGFVQNATLNTTWKYSTTGAAARYTQSGGSHVWQYAPSGTSGSTITWLEGIRIDAATGNIGIKESSPSYTLDVGGTVRAQGDMRVAGNAIVAGTSTLASTLIVNSNIIANTSKGFNFGAQYKNLKLSASGTNFVINISADALILENSSNQDCIVIRGLVSLCSVGVSGASGLDTGTSAISTWYSVWVIYNSTTTAVNTLLSTSVTNPTLPSGYTHKARVGWIKTDGTNKYPLSFVQNNNKVQYKLASGSNLTSLPTIASGIVGNVSTPTWVPYQVISVNVPATAIAVKVIADSAINYTIMAAPNNTFGSFSTVGNKPPVICSFTSSATGGMATTAEMVLENSNVYLASDGSSNVLKVFGWEDAI